MLFREMRLIAASLLAALLTGIMAISAESLLISVLYRDNRAISLGLFILGLEISLIGAMAWAQRSSPESWQRAFYVAALGSFIGAFTGVWPAPSLMFQDAMLGWGTSMLGLGLATRTARRFA
jgi:hypothetical protein